MSWSGRCAAARCRGRGYADCEGMSRSRSRMPKRPVKPTDSAAKLIPDHPTLPKIRDAARDCQACELYKRGTQTVFGDGTPAAEVMLVGEQPGNDEDVSGHPFVAPAARFLLRPREAAATPRPR